ncbi:MAG: hypothetical protein QG574_4968, partial [Cyanobacteriota bacterium erpe_2018_sw_21hr_WHONDRS-SW48-000092_B_bin.40]|nr:hypothetical protein [Cyanobacteriota bacterium erpe_2018_sw_21hr_WHONDRS-SW48-000092_B_bin.40]
MGDTKKPILVRCLSQHELTGKQDVLLLTILINLELVLTRLGKEEEAARCQKRRRALEAKFNAVDMSFPPDEPNVRKPHYGKGRAPEPAATSATQRELREPRQEREMEEDAAAASGIEAEVRTVIAANEQDRDLIANPTKSERRVFDHNETHYGYRSDGSRYSYEVPVLIGVKLNCVATTIRIAFFQSCFSCFLEAAFFLDAAVALKLS